MTPQPPSATELLAGMVAEAIAATTLPSETPDQAPARGGLIAAMIHAIAPADATEAMMACQIVMLRYALLGAMRALSAAGDEKTRLRLQSALNGLSRTTHQWLATYHKPAGGAPIRPAAARSWARARRA